MVLDPSFESLKLSEKIEELARNVKKPVYFVLNKVGDESKDIMLESLNSNKIASVILANTDVFRAGLAGEELDVQLSEIEELAKFLFSLLKIKEVIKRNQGWKIFHCCGIHGKMVIS